MYFIFITLRYITLHAFILRMYLDLYVTLCVTLKISFMTRNKQSAIFTCCHVEPFYFYFLSTLPFYKRARALEESACSSDRFVYYFATSLFF